MIIQALEKAREILKMCEERIKQYPENHPEYIKISGQIMRLKASIEYMEEEQNAEKS